MAEADPPFRQEDTRATYDTVARRYADEIADELNDKPFDRDFLDRFAVRMAGQGHVVELGAGPGHVAAYLAARGVDVSALDLSSAMVDEAKRLFPELQAVVGDMLDLPYANGSLAGVVAFYSIIHFDDEQLACAFDEMTRVLRTGGYAALAFHVGDKAIHREQWWDMPVVLDSRFVPVDLVTRLLEKSGLEVISVEEREPYAPEVEYQSRRAYIVAREPLDV
ncbi:MAG: methyltransferase domain-containing protein [Chloroflexota bacterium]|nr:methyltransferase domain-containing protein [Chloroflexota bacterium]